MKYLFLSILLCVTMQAENLAAATGPLPDAPSHRPFWSVENKVGFSALGMLVAADAITTQRGLNQGLREANPLMRPFVTRGAGGEAARLGSWFWSWGGGRLRVAPNPSLQS